MQEDEHVDQFRLLTGAPVAEWWIFHITMWLCVILLSIYIKRNSLRPGGYLYKYDKKRICKEKANRRRRLRDTLNDPLLVKHWEKKMEYTLGSAELAKEEIRHWRETVVRWEQEGDDEFKDAVFYRRRGHIVVPSLRLATACLCMPLWCLFVLPNSVLTWMYVLLVAGHLVDNRLIVRKYQRMNVGPRSTSAGDSDKAFAAIGIPVAHQVSVV